MTDDVNTTGPSRMRRILAPVVLVVVVALLLILHEDRPRREEIDSGTVVPESFRPDESVSTVSPVEIGSLDDAVTVEDSVRYYIARLGDPAFTETYSEGFTWYIAAEELGMIGRPAIPALIERLGTMDDYERMQALYALRLAAQHENMRELTGGEYVELSPDAFPPPNTHPELVRAWRDWYRMYF